MKLSVCCQEELLNYDDKWDDGVCANCNTHSAAIKVSDYGSCLDCGKKGTSYELFTLHHYYKNPHCEHRIGAPGEKSCWKCENGVWCHEIPYYDYICKICLMKRCGEIDELND